MSVILEKLSEEIFNILKGHGKSLTLYGENGNIVYDPTEAVRMFIMPDKMMISMLSDDGDIEVKLSIGKSVKIKNIETLIKTIRAVCSRLNCFFNIRRYGKNITPKDFAYQVNSKESISEAYYRSLKTTVEDVGDCKIFINHTKNVDEEIRGAASRNIKNIYIQNENKEKILIPTTNINAARAIARHLSNGGKIYDTVGDYIVETSKEFHILKNMIKNIHKIKKDIIKPSNKLKGSLNVKPVKDIRPDNYVSSITESIRKRLNEIRNTFKIISGSRNYKKYHDFISTKNKYETSRIGDDENEKLIEFFNQNNLDLGEIEYVANVMGTKTSDLPMFIVDDDCLMDITTTYRRKFKYGIDYIISENTLIFFNPDCFSEILSFLENKNYQFEIVSNEKLDIPYYASIKSDSIKDIIDIMINELGYSTGYDVNSDDICFREREVYENVVPLLNISNIKFTTEKLNSTYEDKNMAETPNKVLDFANKWISENNVSTDPDRLASELSNFMDGTIVPTIEKQEKREFDNINNELSFKVRIVSDAISDEELSVFLDVIADKLKDKAELTKPEKQIAEKATKLFDESQEKTDEPVEETPKKKSEFSELEEWFSNFNPDLKEDDEIAPSDSAVDSDTVTIRLVDDNATLATLNKIAELTETSISDIVSNHEVTYTGTKNDCDNVVDQITSVMNQNGDLGSVEISGPKDSADQEAENAVDDVISSDELSESDIPELKRLLSIVEDNDDLTSTYIEQNGNFNVINEQTGICFHTVKGNRKVADYYVESFNNENVKQQKKLLKSIIESLIEEASNPNTGIDTMIDEQYIAELRDCLSETEKNSNISFRVIEHDGAYAVVNEQTGIIVNQYSDNTVARKMAENYNDNVDSSRKHLKSIIETALSEAEKEIKTEDADPDEAETDFDDSEEIGEALAFAESVDLSKVVRNNIASHGSRKFSNLDKFNFVNAISEHLFRETVKNEKFRDIGLNEDYFVSIAENFFDNSVLPVLKEKKIFEEIISEEDSDDKIDFSKPVSVSDVDTADQLKKINKKFKELEKKADSLDSGKADFDVIEHDGSFHVIEKGFPAVCLGKFSSENKARTKAADFISDPEYGVEKLQDAIKDVIEETDVEKDEDLSENLIVANEDERDFNSVLDDAAKHVNIDDMLASGDFEEPCVVTPNLENVFCARIAQKMYDYVVSNGGDENSTITPNNFMGPASFILHKNIDKFINAGFEFAANSAYTTNEEEEEEETIPTNDQATFKDEISSDIVTNPEQDHMDYLRKLAGLSK